MNYYKYPKTYHFNWSKPDPHGNDRVHDTCDHFIGKQVVITTKLDGENTSLYKDKIHARSIDSGDHPSRAWVKKLHGDIRHLIPEQLRICGENLQAKHAIYYENLPTYFFVFGVYDNDRNICLSWDDTKIWCALLGLKPVPVLYEGVWDEERAKACYTGRTIIDGVDTGPQEGYVVRITDSFRYEDFTYSVSKFVRQGHVPGDTEHWTKNTYQPNGLKA